MVLHPQDEHEKHGIGEEYPRHSFHPSWPASEECLSPRLAVPNVVKSSRQVTPRNRIRYGEAKNQAEWKKPMEQSNSEEGADVNNQTRT
jgi:hypothetical protein